MPGDVASESASALAVGFFALCLAAFAAAALARRLARALPDAAVRAVGRRPGGTGSAVALALAAAGRETVAALHDGSPPTAGIVSGLLAGAAVTRCCYVARTELRRRDLQRQASAMELPPRITDVDARGFAPTGFDRCFASSRSRSAGRPSPDERWDRRIRSAQHLLVGAGTLLFVANLVVIAVWRPATTPFLVWIYAGCWLLAVLTVPVRLAQAWRWSWRARTVKGRATSLEHVARAHGWSHVSPGNPALRRRWPTSPLLEDGPGHRVLATVIGAVGDWRLWITVESGAPDSTGWSHATQTVYLLWVPGTRFPTTAVVGRESAPALNRVGTPWSVELEEFNRRFVVQAEDDRVSHAVLHPRLVEHLMATLPDAASVVLTDDALTLTAPGPLDVTRVEDHVACLVGLAELLPPHLLLDQRVRVGRR
jgi:hypothetical protein